MEGGDEAVGTLVGLCMMPQLGAEGDSCLRTQSASCYHWLEHLGGIQTLEMPPLVGEVGGKYSVSCPCVSPIHQREIGGHHSCRGRVGDAPLPLTVFLLSLDLFPVAGVLTMGVYPVHDLEAERAHMLPLGMTFPLKPRFSFKALHASVPGLAGPP